MRIAADIIVIATLLHENGPTGVQTHFGAFRRYLLSQQRKVAVVTPYSSPRWLVYPVFAVRKLLNPVSGTASVAWYRYWHRILLQLALRRVLKKHANAIVYAQCPVSARAALDARQTKNQSVALVVHFNRSQADEWIEQQYLSKHSKLAARIRAFESTTLPQLDAIVHVSRFMQRVVADRIPAIACVRSTVIPNFCDASRIASLDATSVDLMSIGTLEPRKNQSFLLHVLAAAGRRNRRLTLALVGDGPDRNRLEKLAAKLGIAPQVIFLGHRIMAAAHLSSARVYVHSATMENLPMAIIEALAYSKPIFAPNVGGIGDMFSDGEQGFFWNLEDSESAAELLIRVLDDDQLLTSLSRNARQRFDEHFCATRVGERLFTFLQESRGGSHSINARAA